MTYTPPLNDMLFTLNHVAGWDGIPEHPDFGALDADTAASILEPAAQLAADILAPLNHSGDKSGAVFSGGDVKTAPGFKDAYRAYCDGGWNAVPFSQEYGGQGLPWLLAFAVQEMWQGANMSFGLCPLLNQGAVEAIEHHGSEEQKAIYLEKLISGAWTGTMNLTEPQAGSDLAAVRTRAEPAGDGTYKIMGQKIFITYGDHDMTDNIIHLVLARLPDAPEGVKGISLFIVPKILADGTRNDVVCAGIEHKLGIHASPTCIMQFGEKGGATGYLVGQANDGLKYMFTMMNNARLSVGLQGVAIAEAAYQKAREYALDRVQGIPVGVAKAVDVSKPPIAAHPDVKRMLLSMECQVQAGRAMAYHAARQIDLARSGDATAQGWVELLTPLVKAWCTDMAVDVASTGVQIHGGMGFIEETGAAQFYRDARILPIYEGTNGIQAADLVFRKVVRDGGASLTLLLDEVAWMQKACAGGVGDDLVSIAQELGVAHAAVVAATESLLKQVRDDAALGAAVSVPFLNAVAGLWAGALMAKASVAAHAMLMDGGSDYAFYQQRILTARFYAENLLSHVCADAHIVTRAARTVVSARIE